MTRICYQQPTLASTHARRRVLEQRRMALIQQASAPQRNDAARRQHQRCRIRQYDELWKKVTTMATRIVAYARGYLCRKHDRERCAAVTRIATTFRGFRARRRLTKQRRAATHITAFVRGCQHRHRCAKQHRAANRIQSVVLEFLSRKKETLLEQVTPHLLQRLMCDNVFEDELLGRFSDTSDDHDASLEEIAAAVSPRGGKRRAAARWHASRRRKTARVSNEMRGFIVDDHHSQGEPRVEEPKAARNYDETDTDVSESWSEDESEEQDTASNDHTSLAMFCRV
eukprot:Stramenopile-MAST_4_protein_2203